MLHNTIGWNLVALSFGFTVLLIPSIHATMIQFQDGTASNVEQGPAVLTAGGTGMAQFLLLLRDGAELVEIENGVVATAVRTFRPAGAAACIRPR